MGLVRRTRRSRRRIVLSQLSVTSFGFSPRTPAFRPRGYMDKRCIFLVSFKTGQHIGVDKVPSSDHGLRHRSSAIVAVMIRATLRLPNNASDCQFAESGYQNAAIAFCRTGMNTPCLLSTRKSLFHPFARSGYAGF